jgi:hypothetical protein
MYNVDDDDDGEEEVENREGRTKECTERWREKCEKSDQLIILNYTYCLQSYFFSRTHSCGNILCIIYTKVGNL